MVAQVADLGNFEMSLGEDLPELLDDLPRPLVPVVHARLSAEQGGEGGVPLDGRIQVLQDRLHVSAFKVLYRALERVDVLLRHRPAQYPAQALVIADTSAPTRATIPVWERD